MAFIKSGTTVTSFAEYQDVIDQDQRLFLSNEGLTDDIVEQHLTRATERILSKLRTTAWWQDYYVKRSPANIMTVADIPALNPSKIKDRYNDFTELCVSMALADYILPNVADFANEDSAERKKMGYYKSRAENLFEELVSAGDWYDFDGSGAISQTERQPGVYNIKRVR